MNLKKIIEPRSIAIFGISKSNPSHPANIVYLKNRHNHNIKIYCINPSGGSFNGEKIYKNISEIEKPVDAAVIVTKAELIPDIMKDCIKAKVAGGLVISGGFAEAGRSDLQEKIRNISIESSFPIIGPNGLGVYSISNINTFFFPDERFVQLKEGNIGLASQSGGVLVDLMIKFAQEQIGLSKAISLGNKAVVDEVDILRYFKHDNTTKVIGLYIEGFSENRGRDFINELRDLDKPVVILKAGKSPTTQSAISSHTAAIAGDYKVFSEILKGTDAIEVINVTDFLSTCEGLSYYNRKKTENVSIITMSGGHGVIASDLFYEAGINVIPFKDTDSTILKEKMTKNIQSIASFTNPLDLTGSATDDDYYTCVRFSLERDYVDALLLLFLPFIPAISSALPARLAELRREFDKPIVCYIPYLPKFGIFIEGFEAHGIPVSHTIDGSVNMLKAIRK